MLFDLRSRGRRRTVQAVYLGLAILMGGGLVLFGVGTGNGVGGLLNAFTAAARATRSRSLSSEEKPRSRQTQQNPNSAAALVAARPGPLDQRRPGQQLQRHHRPVHRRRQEGAEGRRPRRGSSTSRSPRIPIPTSAILAARAYAALGDYADQAATWELEASANPTEAKAFECLAASAYAANQTRKGDLAAAKAVALSPKVQQLTVKTDAPAGQDQPAGRPVLLSASPAPPRANERGNIAPQGPLAQLVEQGTLNPKVGGSSPPRPTPQAPQIRGFRLFWAVRGPQAGSCKRRPAAYPNRHVRLPQPLSHWCFATVRPRVRV